MANLTSSSNVARTLTRKDIAEYLCNKHGVSRGFANSFVKSVFETVIERLCQGEYVKLSGFGVFSLIDKRERPGRNPKTKEECTIDARRVVAFRATNKLKTAVAELFKNQHNIED